VAGRGGIRAAVPGRLAARWGRRKEGGEGETDKWGPGVGVRREKEKGAVRWAAAGWFGGLLGRLGRKVRKGLFFSFQTPFKTTFLFKFKSNSFKLFLNKFYKFCRNHTSNQKPCKPTDDAQSLVVSMFIKLCLIF
jgi:hypothetical protein